MPIPQKGKWALYTNKAGADTILFNDRFMSEGEAFKKEVLLHTKLDTRYP